MRSLRTNSQQMRLSMNKVRCAVIGVGYLGRFHAQKYQNVPQAELVAVCDVSSSVAEAVGQELNVPFFTQYEDLFTQVDAVSIAATTKQHFKIAKAFLEQGIHVLLEKPMTETKEEAQELIELAQKHQAKLQIGHLERFNAARLALDAYLDNPLFIEAERLSPFTPRGADVNVVLDLMIHDIDLILNMVKSPVVSISAQGSAVLTKAIDTANARITFENRCVASLTASRVSVESSRKTKIFQNDSFLLIDYQKKELAISKKGQGEMFPGVAEIVQEQKTLAAGDALFEEIQSFIHCIQNNTQPIVCGQDGLHALETAEQITALIHSNLMEHYG